MPTRNTPVLNQIIEALAGLLISGPPALTRLDVLECSITWLRVRISLAQTEEAINELLRDRFIEP